MNRLAERLLSESGVEFALWGVPPGHSQETLVLAMPGGKPITDRATAEKYAKQLADKHGVKKIRIQTLDTSKDLDWHAAAGLRKG